MQDRGVVGEKEKEKQQWGGHKLGKERHGDRGMETKESYGLRNSSEMT